MKKVLIYAFKPFGDNNKNISEEVLKKVKEKKYLIKEYIKTRFDKKIFLDLVEKYNVDYILGLGQYPKGKIIRIERRAVNWYGGKTRGEYKKIEENGFEFLETNLEINEDENSCIFYDAGRFVCNFSMYILINECRKREIKYGFLHIPKEMEIDLVVKFVDRMVGKLGI